ncbi:MAG TPA: hypothetical protein VH590_06015 [Ktedonobacterales bacterium]
MTGEPSRKLIASLYAANTLESFWQPLLQPRISSEEWAAAMRATISGLPQYQGVAGLAAESVIAAILGETLSGDDPWRLSASKQLYYKIKPLLPRQLGILLRQRYRQRQEHDGFLGWPVEDGYVRLLYGCFANALRRRGLHAAPYLSFWPRGRRFALVLTHDVERADGLAFVETVASLEERLGFRSVFNFVPERYAIDAGFLAALRQRGFEIGVHGLKHDGKLFASRSVFTRRAARINHYLHAWGAVGFRAPYMHRHPQWLQALDVQYDLSFFDTDPYEPQPGGVSSIWPFLLGTFVELPYTLVQDHTLMAILGERSPRLWLEKVDFIERWKGMALVNTHPDYLQAPGGLALYEHFLQALKEREYYWHALPREVAAWWRQRAQFQAACQGGQWNLRQLPGAASVTFTAPEPEQIASAEPRDGAVPASRR